jgi:hypothetical protein
MPRSRVVNTIPSRDRAFRRAVEHVAEGVAQGAPDQLAERLRPLYPRVAVFERQLSGEPGGYYVYRDGHFKNEPSDRWWDAPGTPRICVSVATGELTSVSNEWASFMHSDPDELVGRHFTDFVRPDARMVAKAMFAAVRGEREIVSQALVMRPDGSTMSIEFRAIHRGREIEVYYRPVER